MQHMCPTAEQCNDNSIIHEDANEIIIASWHPQWGGYCGQCLIIFTKQPHSNDLDSNGLGCFNIINWHDGEFPIDPSRKDDCGNNVEPTNYHYCDADQLMNFGQFIKDMQKKHTKVDIFTVKDIVHTCKFKLFDEVVYSSCGHHYDLGNKIDVVAEGLTLGNVYQVKAIVNRYLYASQYGITVDSDNGVEVTIDSGFFTLGNSEIA